MRVSHYPRYLWTLLAVAIVVTAAVRLSEGINLETNILSLLPGTERDPLTTAAVERYNNTFNRTVSFLVGAKDAQTARKAAVEAESILKGSGLFHSVTGRINQDSARAYYRFYRPYQATLITPEDRRLIQSEKRAELQNQLLSRISSPGSGFNSRMLGDDPLLLFTHYLGRTLAETGVNRLRLKDGFLTADHDGHHYVLLTAGSTNDPFSIDFQNRFTGFYNRLQATLQKQFDDVSILSVGIVHNAAAGTRQAKSEISTIGSGSLIGVLLLFLLSFRSLKPVLYAMVPIGFGIVTAILVCSVVFGSIHVMTLVFGASLIGISIDYSFHYFSDQVYRPDSADGRSVLSNILPGITLGLISSLAGFLSFLFAPFPALTQMAVFASSGLSAAYCCVVFWFPALPPLSNRPSPQLGAAARTLLNFWNRHKKPHVPIFLFLSVFSTAGIYIADSNDDIRLLDNTPNSLKAMQEKFKQITGIQPVSQFLLTSGDTPEAVLAAEERLGTALDALIDQGVLGGYRAISTAVPSRQTQLDNYMLVKKAFSDGWVAELMRSIGYSKTVIEDYRNQFQAAEPARLLDMQTWRSADISDGMQWLEPVNGRFASLVYLLNVSEPDRIAKTAETMPNVDYVDQVADISGLFEKYRRLANRLILVAYCVILLLLIGRYGFKTGLLLIAPPLLAGMTALAITGIGGHSLTLFNSLALLLILGIGIDYTIFFAENRGDQLPIMVAILLSATTTVLSFGLLGLSTTPALKSIGIMVFSGIAISVILSPIAGIRIKNFKHQARQLETP